MSGAGKFIAAFFAVAGVPLTIAAIQQGVADTWFALSVLGLYELLVGAVSLVFSVMGETIRRRLVQLADFIDLALGRTFSRYARHYRGYVLETNTHIKARDLAFTPSKMPELDAVYVDVGLAPGSPSLRSGGILPHGPDDGRERHPIHELLDHEEPAVLAVIGAPGGGKTTLLRHTAARAAAAKKRRQRRRVPVMVALRDHSELISNAPNMDLAELIRKAVDLAFKEPKGWWEVQLREGNCIILLDGLDEVARKTDRTAVSEWIERQISKHSANDFVITSRPHGYQTAVIPQATVLQVRPFTTKQIHDFVHAWCLATERLAAGKTGPEIDRRASEEADDLIGQLAVSPALQDLAVNPLLLTMMVLVHRERRALPSGRAALYNQVCDVMLWRRMESKKLEVTPSGTVRQRILASLAYEMMLAETRDFRRTDVVAVFDRMLRNIDTDLPAEALLESIVDSSGLLIERERDLFTFSHHTLCEYLASVHIREQGLVSKLISEIGNPWWRETTLLYVADTDANAIVEACLERDSGFSLSLAFDCIRNHGQINRKLRERIDDLRREAFTDDASPDHRRRVARALAVGHLSKLVALDDGTLICPEPIKMDLYWLFCKDTGTLLPDGFNGLDLDSPGAARGMWRNEAFRFMAWLNATSTERRAGTYLLPSSSELGRLLDSGLKFTYRSKTDRPITFDTEDQITPSALEIPLEELGRLATDLYLAEAVLFARKIQTTPYGASTAMIDRIALLLEYIWAFAVFGPNRHMPAEPKIRRAKMTIEAIRAAPFPMQSSLTSEFLALLLEIHDELGAYDVGQIFDRVPENSHSDMFTRSAVTGIALGKMLHQAEIVYLNAKGESDSVITALRDLERSLDNQILGWLDASHYGASRVDPEQLDDLAVTLHVACSTIMDVPSEVNVWAAQSATRLLAKAEPILIRRVRATESELVSIGIAAVVLAAESEHLDLPVAAEQFLVVAEGVSRLRDRLNGRAPLEILFLARE